MRLGVSVAAAVMALGVAPAAFAERVVFSVYFDWGSVSLDAKAKEAVAGSLKRAKACAHNGITVLGHTDLSEDNVSELATERARAVKDELIAKGLSTSSIGFVGRSDRQPAVPTADGVKEPKNRRAEIVLVCD